MNCILFMLLLAELPWRSVLSENTTTNTEKIHLDVLRKKSQIPNVIQKLGVRSKVLLGEPRGTEHSRNRSNHRNQSSEGGSAGNTENTENTESSELVIDSGNVGDFKSRNVRNIDVEDLVNSEREIDAVTDRSEYSTKNNGFVTHGNSDTLVDTKLLRRSKAEVTAPSDHSNQAQTTVSNHGNSGNYGDRGNYVLVRRERELKIRGGGEKHMDGGDLNNQDNLDQVVLGPCSGWAGSALFGYTLGSMGPYALVGSVSLNVCMVLYFVAVFLVRGVSSRLAEKYPTALSLRNLTEDHPWVVGKVVTEQLSTWVLILSVVGVLAATDLTRHPFHGATCAEVVALVFSANIGRYTFRLLQDVYLCEHVTRWWENTIHHLVAIFCYGSMVCYGENLFLGAFGILMEANTFCFDFLMVFKKLDKEIHQSIQYFFAVTGFIMTIFLRFLLPLATVISACAVQSPLGMRSVPLGALFLAGVFFTAMNVSLAHRSLKKVKKILKAKRTDQMQTAVTSKPDSKRNILPTTSPLVDVLAQRNSTTGAILCNNLTDSDRKTEKSLFGMELLKQYQKDGISANHSAGHNSANYSAGHNLANYSAGHNSAEFSAERNLVRPPGTDLEATFSAPEVLSNHSFPHTSTQSYSLKLCPEIEPANLSAHHTTARFSAATENPETDLSGVFFDRRCRFLGRKSRNNSSDSSEAFICDIDNMFNDRVEIDLAELPAEDDLSNHSVDADLSNDPDNADLQHHSHRLNLSNHSATVDHLEFEDISLTSV